MMMIIIIIIIIIIINKHIEKAKEELQRVHKRNFQNYRNFSGIFNLDVVVQLIILVHSLNKGNRVNRWS